mmetsp:Transcript_31964/g.69793  ORF Transcript_31964/g.69793 Transcript_31964/m.69793 type:complete len:281 (-) Transcript_31964:527-1369(-)
MRTAVPNSVPTPEAKPWTCSSVMGPPPSCTGASTFCTSSYVPVRMPCASAAPMVAGMNPRYSPVGPSVFHVLTSSLTLIFPTEACTLVLIVSRGCMVKVVDPEASPPASAAIAKAFPPPPCVAGGAMGTNVAASYHAALASALSYSCSRGSSIKKLRNEPYEMYPSGDLPRNLIMASAFLSVASSPSLSREALICLVRTAPPNVRFIELKVRNILDSFIPITALNSSQPIEFVKWFRFARRMNECAYDSGRFRERIARFKSSILRRPSPSSSNSLKNNRP